MARDANRCGDCRHYVETTSPVYEGLRLFSESCGDCAHPALLALPACITRHKCYRYSGAACAAFEARQQAPAPDVLSSIR